MVGGIGVVVSGLVVVGSVGGGNVVSRFEEQSPNLSFKSSTAMSLAGGPPLVPSIRTCRK